MTPRYSEGGLIDVLDADRKKSATSPHPFPVYRMSLGTEPDGTPRNFLVAEEERDAYDSLESDSNGRVLAAAVRAGDDDARYALADWFEEHNFPAAAFNIRSAIARGRMPPGGMPIDLDL